MPTRGRGRFQGVYLFAQMKKVRTILGVCPLLDILFDDMTVRDQLQMFYTFKNPKNFLINQGGSGNDNSFASLYMQSEVEKWLDKLKSREWKDEY